MDKKTIIKAAIIALTAMSFTCAQAQDTGVLEKVRSNPALARGYYYVNPNGAQRQSKAPKGYKPFYISHFARHGARYCWEDVYTRLDTTLRNAHDEGKLTPKGEELYRTFHPWAEQLSRHTGELVRKGWDQHACSARNIVNAFPEVFAKGASVSATSSDVDRCEMSMASYCLELCRQRPEMPIYEYVSITDFDAVRPTAREWPGLFPVQTVPNPFGDRRPTTANPASDVVGQYFTDLSWVESNFGTDDMCEDLYTLWCCLQCADEPVEMDNPFTPEQEAANFQRGCYDAFVHDTKYKYESWPVAADIVEKAEARIASGERGADLRFSHDSHFGPLYVLLDIDGGGTVAPSPDEQYQYFQTYDICKATNLHFVLYRSRKSPDILFKLLLNGVETTLPLEPVEGPYYRWDDFKALVNSLDPRK